MMAETTEDTPFPAEADLAAAASIPLGPAGRFQIVATTGANGEPTAFLIDTTDGRSWVLGPAGGGPGRWLRLEYDRDPPLPAP